MSHTPSKIYIFAITFFFACAFLLAGWVVVRANGYQVFFQPLRFVKTGVITLTVHPKSGTMIRLNGVDQPPGVTDFTDLAPGRYTIEVVHEGYFSWETTVDLRGGSALRYPDVRLFYREPVRSPVVSESEQANLLKILAKPEQFQSGLQVIGDVEIWAEDRLVGRYSQSVQQALWLPGKHHVLYLMNNQLHVVDLSGKNDHILLSFSEDSVVQFAPLSGGQELAIALDGQVEIAQITAAKTLFQLHTLTPFQGMENEVESQ